MTRPPMFSFTAGAGDVVADLDRLMEFGAFVEGTSRSGKTNLVRVLLEQTYGLVQHIVLDIEGEYATLRSIERPYLIVGNGRDVALPAEPDAIKRFVLAIVEKGVSVIFDLSEHDTDEQHTIVAAVCDALVSLPENHSGAAAVVLEELQEFAPEGGGKGTALNSVKRLAKRGLKRGFFIIGASQRVSDVSKGVVTMLKSKLIGGTDHKDAPRALEELGLPTRDRAAITDLPQGEFWVKGPAFERHAQHVRVPRSVTAPPKRKRGDPPTPAAEAPAEIAALAAALAASVTKEEEPTPAQSSGRAMVPVADDAARRARREAIIQRERDAARHEEAQRHERYRNVLQQQTNAALAELRPLKAMLQDVIAGIEAAVAAFVAVDSGIDEQWIKPVAPDPDDSVASILQGAADGFRREAASYTKEADRLERDAVRHISDAPSANPLLRLTKEVPTDATPRELSSAQQAILDALAWYGDHGTSEPRKGQVAALIGIPVDNRIFRMHVSVDRSRGLLEDTQHTLRLTAAGAALANPSRMPASRRALHDVWRAKLNGSHQVAMFDVLAKAYPRRLQKRALADAVGIAVDNRIFRMHLSVLRKLGIAEDSQHDVGMNPALFPEGLP